MDLKRFSKEKNRTKSNPPKDKIHFEQIITYNISCNPSHQHPMETHTSPSDGVSCTLTQSSAAARRSSCRLSITEWQHMSETEDNQSIISHHCTMMILLVDTKDISLLKPLGAKLLFSVAVSGLRIHLMLFFFLKSLFQKIQSQGPRYVFRNDHFQGYHRSYCTTI